VDDPVSDSSAMFFVSTPAYEALRDELVARVAAGGRAAEVLSVERRRFSDGELYQRLESDVRGRDVVLVSGTHDEVSTLAAYDLACAISRYGAKRLTWVLPYFGCQTMERAVKSGEVVTAKTRARLISTVPPTPWGNRILLLDLHTPGIPHYFGDNLQAFHLYAKPLILDAARAFGGEDFVLGAPDAGRAKWVQSLANDLGVPAALVTKRRISDGVVEVTGLEGQVSGKRVVIYDDMIRTGGTLIRAAEAYLAAGASACYAVTTHLVLPDDAAERILGSDAIQGVAGTDSHPRAALAAAAGCEVHSVAGIYADWLLNG
jgi:ribose-phosphate pyrophosphokinase